MYLPLKYQPSTLDALSTQKYMTNLDRGLRLLASSHNASTHHTRGRDIYVKGPNLSRGIYVKGPNLRRGIYVKGPNLSRGIYVKGPHLRRGIYVRGRSAER